jgi:hypothetical protein
VSDAGAGEGCDCAAISGAEDGSVMEGRVGVCGECAGGEHVEVWADGVVEF